MRGLTVFISDLRNCRARELEEKRINKEMANIRSKFKDPALSGYHKKKYVCKLLYIYILGWEVDFGHLEAINLISSPKYSEKQIVKQGYLAVTLLLTENSEFLRLVINSIKKDLDDVNELNNCLALQAIANIGGKELADALMSEVLKLMSPTRSRSSFVRKKAALCLLRLFRRHVDFTPPPEWAQQILPIMDDPDMGVALSGTSLVLALVQQYPAQYSQSTTKAINRLNKIIVEKEVRTDYLYYKIPVPWLQVKLLRLLQYYDNIEPNALTTLLNLLQIIISDAQNMAKNPQQANAQCAILFEAINLAIHIAPDSSLVQESIDLLGKFISSKETNIRYVGLETMAHVAAFANSVDVLKSHQETISTSLQDKDISVRRRALDLMYSMCDYSNCKGIVAELLQYLSLADFAIREDVVLKIAILTEKFATEYNWYFDVFLQLCSVAGDNISDDVWHRVVQIVTNNEGLQANAARSVVNSMKGIGCHEILVKMGSYILGEFGHLISDEPGYAPIEQLHAVLANISSCQTTARALLLTTLLKFANIFPEIKMDILAVLEQYRYVLDVELQQRAAEYYAIVTMPNTDVLEAVCDAMPPFPERESALLSRLRKKTEDTEDKRTWVIGGKDANRLQRKETKTGRPAMGAASTTSNRDNAVASNSPTGLLFLHLLQNSSGILFEDNYIQIGVKSEYHQHLGRFGLFIGNKTTSDLENVSLVLASPPPHQESAVTLTVIQPIGSNIPAQSQLCQMYNIQCHSAISTLPHITFSYKSGADSGRLVDLDLPIDNIKFMDPVTMSSEEFFNRWRQIGGEPREKQSVVQSSRKLEEIHDILLKLNLSVMENIDPNPSNFVGASIFNTSSKIGCLMRIEVNDQMLLKITVRTTNENVSVSLAAIMEKLVK